MLTRNLSRLDHPYVIAEIGMHHENDPARLEKYIQAASDAGAAAVKVQHYRKDDLCAPHCPAHWQGGEMKTQRECLTDPDPKVLIEGWQMAQDCGVDYIVSFFHHDDINTIPCDAIKIASGDSSYTRLVVAAARTGLPLFVSTGGHKDWKHLKTLASIVGHDRCIPMHCCVRYPSTVADVKAGDNIKRMRAILNDRRPPHQQYHIGYSDHCKGIQSCFEAVHTGAVVIEKHFTIEPERTDMDHYHSASPADLAVLCHAPLPTTPSYVGSWDRECNDHDTGAHVTRHRVVLDHKEHYWRI